MLHISIKAEKVFELFGFPVTNSLLSTYILLCIFLGIGLIYEKKIYAIFFPLNALYSLFESILKEKTAVFFPLVGSFFVFILFSNWFGLIPGVESVLLKRGREIVPLLRGITADLNMTLVLAAAAFFAIQWSGVAHLGFKNYMRKFINVTSPLNVFVGFLEIISEFSKIISFAFRLFGNIFAGEVLLAVIAFLIPVFASFPFLLLEIFVGFIQAIVFSLLTAVFINMATVKTDH